MQKNCQICKVNSKKYKCPKCKIPYCSIECSNIHKTSCQNLKKENSAQNKKGYELTVLQDDPEIIKSNFIEDEEMRIPESKLKLLKKNQELVKMLKNPQIRNMLMKIDNSKQRITQLQRAMLNQDFLRMADAILDVVTPEN